MAADLATTPTSGLRVQAFGDAHLMNFGAFATPERNIIFDINDLDETLPAPFEWDLKRLAASAVIAAQHLRLPESDAARVAIDCARAYRERMADYASMRALDVWYDKIDLQKYEDRTGDPQVVAEARRRFARRIEREQRKTVPDHLYPKPVTEEGSCVAPANWLLASAAATAPRLPRARAAANWARTPSCPNDDADQDTPAANAQHSVVDPSSIRRVVVGGRVRSLHPLEGRANS